MNCSLISTVVGCLADNGVPLRSAAIHYEYRIGAAGESILYKTRYTESDGITVITLGATETVSVGACDAPYASEKISYTLAGVTYSGWKQFYQRDGVYTEVIRDLRGNVISGALEVVPPAPAPTVTVPLNQYNINELAVVTTPTTLTGYHAVALKVVGGDVEISSGGSPIVFTEGEIIHFEADGLLANPIIINPLTALSSVVVATTK